MSKVWLNKKSLSSWAVMYCINIEDRPGIRQHVITKFDAFFYIHKNGYKDRRLESILNTWRVDDI